jgi:hypothetical protein
MRMVQYCSFKYHINTVNSDYSCGYLRKGSETRDSTSPWQPVLHCQRKQMKSRSMLLSARTWHAAFRASTVNEILFPAGKSLFLRSKRKHVTRCTTTVQLLRSKTVYTYTCLAVRGYLVPLCSFIAHIQPAHCCKANDKILHQLMNYSYHLTQIF